MKIPSITDKAIQEIKSNINNDTLRVLRPVIHFEEIFDNSGNVVEISAIFANESLFWSDINNLIDAYKKISGISEIPFTDGIIPLKEVPYEFEGYYIRITKSSLNQQLMQIHLGKKKWMNNKNRNLISEIINNCKRNLSSWENSLDIWKDTPYDKSRVSKEEDIDPSDLLELV